MPSSPVSPPGPAAVAAGGAFARGRAALLGVAVLLLALVLTAALHVLSLLHWRTAGETPLTVIEVLRVDDSSIQPPSAAPGTPATLPYFEAAGGAGEARRPFWLVARVSLAQAADTTWALSFIHRTSVLVYLDGRLLANSVPLDEADLPPRNLQIGHRRLKASVPADWLGAGDHELAVRVGAAGPNGASVSRLMLGPLPVVEAAERPRDFWLGVRLLTLLSALVIGTLLLFTWLVDRRERLYLWSALYLLMLALLLSPQVLSEPPLPAPWWRMLLDAADVFAKGLAVVVIVAWAAPRLRWAPRFALGYMLLALPVDLLAAYHQVPWGHFGHPWPWWALGSRLLMLALATAVALAAWVQRPRLDRLGTAALAALTLWIWADVSLFALVLPGVVGVVDLNVVAYAGWALWVAMLLYRRLVDMRRREQQLRDELAQQLLARSDQLHAQFAALKSSEQARAASAERERLLQEMHDGLGSQLASAKMLASGGQLTNAEMVDVLDTCLREMRLTVDALGVTDGDLGVLLATLRHRLEPALRAGGVVLDWRVEDTPRVPTLEGTGAREFARIVQEALTNIVHHAGASRVEIGTRSASGGQSVQIRIADDGRGMPAQPSLGRGVRGMRQRAQRLAATIEWRAVPAPGHGTELLIELPLARG